MHELLRADTEHADAMMLLRYLETRRSSEPLTTREALEAIYRRQGTAINTLDAFHIHTVVTRLNLAGIPVSLQNPTPPVNLQAAYAALDRLPMVPTFRLTAGRTTDSPTH